VNVIADARAVGRRIVRAAPFWVGDNRVFYHYSPLTFMKPSHYKPVTVLPDNCRSNSLVLSLEAFRGVAETGGRHFHGSQNL
jgi:hypothetical protein